MITYTEEGSHDHEPSQPMIDRAVMMMSVQPIMDLTRYPNLSDETIRNIDLKGARVIITDAGTLRNLNLDKPFRATIYCTEQRYADKIKQHHT